MFPPTPLRRSVTLAALAAAALLTAATPAAASPTAVRSAPSSERIVGGYTPHPSQWPWIAAVGRSPAATPNLSGYQRQFCGGTLIAPRVVITAAHCVVDDGVIASADSLGVALGRRNLNAGGGEDHEITDVAVHPDYDTETIAHDVALLRLDTPSAQTPAALDPGFRLSEGLVATVMGWGDTYSGSGEGSEDLRAADVALWSSDHCEAAYADFDWHHDPSTMLCAGWADGGNNTCQGDSGGPLMIPDSNGTWRLIGTVSWADRCAVAGRPTNFAWVGAPSIRPWIVSTANALNADRPEDHATSGGGNATATTTTVPRTARAALRVYGVSARRRAIRFSLTRAATVRIKIRGRRGTLRTIRRSAHAGRNTVVVRRPRGARKVKLIARAADGSRASASKRFQR